MAVKLDFSTAAIGLGSNLGDRLQTLRQAVAAISNIPETQVLEVSSVWETEPVGYLEQPLFLNAALTLNTRLTPWQLLKQLQEIENIHRRIRTLKDGPRTLDLDLLYMDDLVMEEEALFLPHPRLHERPFVIAPLAEVSPDWRHPIYGITVSDLWERFSCQGGIMRCKATLVGS